MFIKSIELKNIRSYLDSKVEFPQGSTLLAGDIGCGKSTLLHAVEFALFGLRKGELSGSDLLRHGKNNGLVRLNFELGGNEITIERALKRGKENIAQESGMLKVNDKQHSLTAMELKSHILELLGYSQDMLKKNKPLFRYTVYTPQEHMKVIMWDKEQRLTTLRTIFGVDKYGTIRNNAKLLLTEMRAMKREQEAFARDIGLDEARLEELKEGKKTVSHSIFDEKLRLQEVERRLKKVQDDLDLVKKDFEQLNEKKHELTRKETELRAKETRLGRLTSELIMIEDKIALLKTEMEGIPNTSLPELHSFLIDLEAKRDTLISERAVLRKDIENLHPVYEKGVCSVCGQIVKDREEFRKHIEVKRERLAGVENELDSLSSSILDTKNSISSAERCQHIGKTCEEMLNRKSGLQSEKDQIDSEAATLSNELDELRPRLERYDGIYSDIRDREKTINSMLSEKLSVEKAISKLEQQIENFEEHMNEVANRIQQKEAAKMKSARLSQLINWFDPFTSLMETMEKYVMVAIQKEFDQYFQKWFSVIMGDQLSVKIDEQFTPKIEQNSYETDYENLSGGEKTSVALAYRLALNKVINDMIENIKTKDLLILDEPTDGFSTDQLDRIRDVINELSLKQIIIVSHEPKIDTYVDNVIRVYKENHVSRVAY
jgi:exonuclease SbcC